MTPVKPADKRRKYEAACRAAAVRRGAEPGQPPARAARAQVLGTSAAPLGRWARATRQPQAGGNGKLRLEHKQWWAALARAERERGSLKKAPTIFSHPTR